MLLVPTTSLKAGMVLAHPVYHPASTDMILLNKGYVLNDEMITRLHDFALTHVWVEFPGLEEVDRKTNERINRGHMALFQVLNGSVDKMEKRVAVKVNLRQYKRAVRQMLMEIVTDPDHEVITHQLSGCGPLLSGHLANCCYLSLLIGAHMSGYLRHERSTLPPGVAENTAQLGLGALLHDVGKLNMTDEMQAKSIIDQEADWPEYRMHVQAGYEEVRETVPVVAANIVLNHHQRYDGTGFPIRQKHQGDQPPAPLQGNNIHIFSRIVAVVDAFDHLLCPNGEIVPTIQAIHAIKSEKFAGWFDPVVVETMLRLIPPFMVGSVITLSDGTNAVVVVNHPEAPCRPSVKLLSGPLCQKNTRIRGRQLDLRMCRELSIAAVDGFDVRPYLYNGELEPLQEQESEMITI
jgi:HD-GYP domain-containing protein (c-di-GMP phosphodiesterase class II)